MGAGIATGGGAGLAAAPGVTSGSSAAAAVVERSRRARAVSAKSPGCTSLDPVQAERTDLSGRNGATFYPRQLPRVRPDPRNAPSQCSREQATEHVSTFWRLSAPRGNKDPLFLIPSC